MESLPESDEEQHISFKPKERYANVSSGQSTKKRKMREMTTFSEENDGGNSHDDEYFKHSDKGRDAIAMKTKIKQESDSESDSVEEIQDSQLQRNVKMESSFNYEGNSSKRLKSSEEEYKNAFDSDGDSDGEPEEERKTMGMGNKGMDYAKFMELGSEEGTHNKRSSSSSSSSKLDGEKKAKRMMRWMGYQEGKGLGKNAQGRLHPVEASKQLGRRGFGLHVLGLEVASLKWDPEMEKIKVIEDIEWLPNRHSRVPTSEDMNGWMECGVKKEVLEGETTFCDPEILTDVINSKTVFDKLDKSEKLHARTRSNPYETIRGAFFLNRAAVKMANIDKACNFMFSKPENLKKGDLLYFADVCAGPGGFSEYILWRRKWHAKGFGFTLKNSNDFKLDQFYAGPCETFHPFYGPKGDGDVCSMENQKAFKEIIMEHTNGEGVHFMMSDGGFSVLGQENIQEILSKQLYLCQCLVALSIVRTGGNFVTKLFDLFTPFSAGLVYLMYRCFEEISIFKPNSSRPANSERYLICKGKRHNTRDVESYLRRANAQILKNDPNNDVMQLVPLAELETEEKFMQYLKESNNILGRRQITSLIKIAAYCENTTLIEQRQNEMRTECLKYWEIPDNNRTRPRPVSAYEKFRQLVQGETRGFQKPEELTTANIESNILNQPYDWFYLPCSTGKHTDENNTATLYMGMGRRNVYRYTNGSWPLVADMKLELPANTLIYAEVTQECIKENKHQVRMQVLHIIDAHTLGGEDINEKYIEQRHELIKKFCKALRKPPPMYSSDDDPEFYVPIRAKDLYSLSVNIDKLQLTQRNMKNNSLALGYNLSSMLFDKKTSNQETSYFIPNSILFVKSINDPWHRYVSRTTKQTYVYNCKTKSSDFEERRPAAAEASFMNAFETRVIWYWNHSDALTIKYVTDSIKDKCDTRGTSIRAEDRV